jgi:TM2 domain.
MGYILWIFGFLGAHRFYYGKPVSGTIYLFTLGLLGIGWIIDLFLIPSMDREADRRYIEGPIDYNITWDITNICRLFRTTSFLHAKMDFGFIIFNQCWIVRDRHCL